MLVHKDFRGRESNNAKAADKKINRGSCGVDEVKDLLV
jgi:hypothetical protein